MTSRVVAVGPGSALIEALRVMDSAGVRHLPVVEGTRCVGLLTEVDTLRQLVTHALVQPESTARLTAAEVCRRPAPVVPVWATRGRHAREVVVASRGLDGPVADLLGFTALRVAQHAGCPVVVIRNSAVGDPGGPVVVGVDDSAGSDAAVEFALEYAARCAAPLVALHAWSDVRIPEQETTVWRTFDWATVAAEQEQLLTERLAGWQDKYPDVEVRRVVARDRPVRRLLEAATGARMLVVGSRGRGGVQGMLLGSTSQSLLYVAPCPIAIVRY